MQRIGKYLYYSAGPMMRVCYGNFQLVPTSLDLSMALFLPFWPEVLYPPHGTRGLRGSLSHQWGVGTPKISCDVNGLELKSPIAFQPKMTS